MGKSMAEVHAEGGHANHPRRRCPECAAQIAPGQVRLRSIWTRFCDDDSGREPFHGYTDGRRWNGFECPHLPLGELLRVLGVLVAWGDEKSYERIDDHNIRVRGVVDGDDYTMTAKRCSTTDGDLWLFDCGGSWTFVEAISDADLDTPPPPCPHPEHRLGTCGSLKKHQRVCMSCGEVVLAPRSRRKI